MIDVHVHFRDWNQSNKETILHGMETGAKAGFNAFFDMPNTNPPVTDMEAVKKRLETGLEAEKKLSELGYMVHYYTYCGLTEDKNQIKEMVQAYNSLHPRVCGLKMFASQSTGDMGIVERQAQNSVYRTLAEMDYRGVLAVHCEKEALFCPSESAHSRKRPPISEAQSVIDQIESAEEALFKGTLHIAHISTAGALEAVKQARSRGKIKVTCGATPHHCLLNALAETDFVKMNPPLRPESDRLAVWNALFDGTIDWIESDHAPHTLEDKGKGACGLPGFEGMLLLIRELRQAGMTESRLSALLCTNAPKAFGIGIDVSPVPVVTDQMVKEAREAYPFSAWRN